MILLWGTDPKEKKSAWKFMDKSAYNASINNHEKVVKN